MWQLETAVGSGHSFRAWSLGSSGTEERIRKTSPSVVSVASGTEEGCPATATIGNPKSLRIQFHDPARAEHVTLPGVPGV